MLRNDQQIFAISCGLIFCLTIGCSQRAANTNTDNGDSNKGPNPREVLGDKRTAEREKKRRYYEEIEEKAIPVLKKLPRDEFRPKSVLAALSDDRPDWSDPRWMRARAHTIARYYHVRDHWIRVWDVASGKMIHKFPAENRAIFAISPDGKSIAWFGQLGSKLHITELKSNLRRSISTRCGQLTSLDYSPDGKIVAVSGVNASWTETKIEIWRAEAQTLVRTISVPGHATRVQFSPNGRLIGVRRGYSVILFDTNNWSQLKIIKTRYEVDEFAFSPDGWSIALSGFKDGHQMELLDLATGTKTVLPALDGFAGPNPYGGGIAFDPMERYIAYANLFEFALWDGTKGTLIVRVDWDTCPPLTSRNIQFSAGGRFLYAAGSKVCIWEVEELLKKYAIKN